MHGSGISVALDGSRQGAVSAIQARGIGVFEVMSGSAWTHAGTGNRRAFSDVGGGDETWRMMRATSPGVHARLGMAGGVLAFPNSWQAGGVAVYNFVLDTAAKGSESQHLGRRAAWELRLRPSCIIASWALGELLRTCGSTEPASQPTTARTCYFTKSPDPGTRQHQCLQ